MKAPVGPRHHALHHFLRGSRQVRPQDPRHSQSYPQVTLVGSELGRPDDGTDPTGFFNCEFYVGLRPYTDKPGSRVPFTPRADLIADLEKKLAPIPA